MDEVRKHLHIVVCGDNINSLGIVRSLGEKGIQPIAIIVQEGHIPLVGRSKYVQQVIQTTSMDESLMVLKTYANKDNKPFVYTTDDNHQSLLDEHYDELKNKFYIFNGGANGRISQFNNKDIQCELAQQIGFCIPKSEVVNRGVLPKTLTYPIFTKTLNPCMNGWKRDVMICYSEDELVTAYKHMVSEKFILQEYVVKKGEYSIQGISIDGGKSIYMPFERMYLRYSPTTFGGYMYYQPFHNEMLREKIHSMIKQIGYSGCFEIEFLVDRNDNLFFLEVNLRFSASNYGLTIGGFNLPYIWACSTLTGEIDLNLIALREHRFYMENEVTDIRYIKQIGCFNWIRDFFKADGYYLGNAKDPLPAISFWWHKILRYLKK